MCVPLAQSLPHHVLFVTLCITMSIPHNIYCTAICFFICLTSEVCLSQKAQVHFNSLVCCVFLLVPQHAVGPFAFHSLSLSYVCGCGTIFIQYLMSCLSVFGHLSPCARRCSSTRGQVVFARHWLSSSRGHAEAK